MGIQSGSLEVVAPSGPASSRFGVILIGKNELPRRTARGKTAQGLLEVTEGRSPLSEVRREFPQDALDGYRNGYAPERSVGSGLEAVDVRAPRVRDVPPEAEYEAWKRRPLAGQRGAKLRTWTRLDDFYQSLRLTLQALLAELHVAPPSTMFCR